MSKEKLLIVGSGGFGRVVLEHVVNNYNCAFVDDRYELGTEIFGTKVVGHITSLSKLFAEYKLLNVAIGDNNLREKIYENAAKIGYDFPNIIVENVYISPFAEIGYGCIFLNNVCIQNSSHVGNGVILNPGVEIHHGSTVEDFALIYTNSVIRTYAKVGRRVKVGSNVTVSNGATVLDGEVIEDGQVVKETTAIRRIWT